MCIRDRGAAALAAKAGMGFGANVRDAEYRQVQRFSFSNIEHFSTASLITRLTNDVSSVQMTLMMGMRMLVRAPVMLITALVMALRISQMCIRDRYSRDSPPLWRRSWPPWR